METNYSFFYQYLFIITLLIQLICNISVYFISPYIIEIQLNEFTKHTQHIWQRNMSLILVTCFTSIQVIIMILATMAMLSEMKFLYIRPIKIFLLYLNVIFTLSLLFWCNMLYNANSIYFEGMLLHHHHVNYYYISLIYYSTAILTHSGFGDIYSKYLLSELITLIGQIIGLIFNIFIFSLALNHFNLFLQVSKGVNKLINHPKTNTPNRLKRLLKYLRSFVFIERTRKLIIKYLLLIVVLIQLLGIGILLLFDPKIYDLEHKLKDEKNQHMAAEIFYILLCIINSFFVIFTSLRLITKVNNKEISFTFLLQSYASTIITFASIYTTLYVFESYENHMFGGNTLPSCNKGQNSLQCALDLHFTFIYFSTCTFTSTGLGDIYAKNEFSRLIVSLQMLLNIVYNVVIFGIGISYLISNLTAQSKQIYQQTTSSKEQQQEENK